MRLLRAATALFFAGAAASASSCATDAGVGDEGAVGGFGGASGIAGDAGDAGPTPGDGSAASGWGGSGAGDGSGWPTGGFGSPCSQPSECQSDQCVDVGQKAPAEVCVTPCKDGSACPAGGYCAWHPVEGYLCVPDRGNQCAPCEEDADCPNVVDRCLVSPNVDRFCARDCSFDSSCPTGTSCVDPQSYDPGSGSGGSGGTGGDAGTPKPPRACVPPNDESCPCDAKRDGVMRKCSAMSGSLLCEGTEECDGAQQSWVGCTAGTPKPEQCDGADNDCNGDVDDGDAEQMCAGQGNPAHASWACVQGQCDVGECDQGWASYPPSLPPSAGCPCQLESSEPNDTCADAKNAGSVTDQNTVALGIKGRLTSDTDEDWHKLTTVDTDEGTTNGYHVHMEFSAPSPNDEFVFDVIRGDACAAPAANHSGLSSYDWCVDGTGTDAGGKPIGEQSCGAQAAIHCGSHDKPYLVRIRRRPGAAGTCSEYTLGVTARGGACDFSQATGACDPQVPES
jgi:hypothetical protein